MMKRLAAILPIALFLLPFALHAGGKQETTSDRVIIRGAEQVPNLIAPPVWDGQAFSLNSSIYDYLIEMDVATGELVPPLATEWSTPDGRVWTFKLRRGVTVHDGSSFTPEDVRYTLLLTQDPSVGHLKSEDFPVVERIDLPASHRYTHDDPAAGSRHGRTRGAR